MNTTTETIEKKEINNELSVTLIPCEKSDRFSMEMDESTFSHLYKLVEDNAAFNDRINFQTVINSALSEMIKNRPQMTNQCLDAISYFNELLMSIAKNGKTARQFEDAMMPAGVKGGLW